MRRVLLLSACALVVCFAQVVADIPKLINYQGMLTGDAGERLDGIFEMFFRI